LWNLRKGALDNLMVIRLANEPVMRPTPPKLVPTARALQLLTWSSKMMVVGTLLTA